MFIENTQAFSFFVEVLDQPRQVEIAISRHVPKTIGTFRCLWIFSEQQPIEMPGPVLLLQRYLFVVKFCLNYQFV